MLCNPFHPFSSAGRVTVSVLMFLSDVFVKVFFYQDWIHPRSYQSSTSLNHTRPHTLKLTSTFCLLVSVACA